MVSLAQVQASNAQIATVLPPGLVAVFVDATSGIGETSLKQFVKHAHKPRAYFVGRSQEAGDRIQVECQKLNSEGEYIFIQADTSLIQNVDAVCRNIKSSEKAINILFLSTGTLIPGIETSEGLHYAASLIFHSRNRFAVNLLPLLQRATGLRRVVSVLAATKEGPVKTSDFQGRGVPILQQRGHGASLVTFSLEAIAKKAPDVSFIHDFPGPVKSNIARGGNVAMVAMRWIFKVIGPFVYIPTVESGERHLFLATSSMYPAKINDDASGVPLVDGLTVAKGTDGKPGSGVYSIDEKCESADLKVEELLAKLRGEGIVEKVWENVEGEFKRITGVVAV